MKSELVVIADQHAAVNTFSGLVHRINARQAAYQAKWLKSTFIAKISRDNTGDRCPGGLEAKGSLITKQTFDFIGVSKRRTSKSLIRMSGSV